MSIPKEAEPDAIELAKEALCEMAPLEAGYFLRDLGLNFPVTMDALKHAKKDMGIITRTVTNKTAMKEMCPSFTQEQINKSTKLEIVHCLSFTHYCLRENLNKLITQAKVLG